MTKRQVFHPVQIFDFSLVDEAKARQKDPDALIEAIKAEDVPAALAAIEADKAEFTADEREHLAKSGAAMPDGGFPIRNAADLHNAMQAIGRAKNPTAARAHIRKRASVLGLESELTEAFKADDLAEAEKAGAEFSGKNRSVLTSMLAALKKLLGEEAKEPEHADIAAQLEAASKADVGDATADGAVAEEDEMGFTLDELKGAISEATAPLAERLAALETAKAAPSEPVVAEKAATIVARPLEETIQDAIATYEARKAGGFAAAQAGGTGAFPLLNTNGRQKLREIAKAVPREQRPSLEESLRVLTGRDPFTGALPTEE